jgi:arabinogalactan endo-1,4-beta-galactosidase
MNAAGKLGATLVFLAGWLAVSPCGSLCAPAHFIKGADVSFLEKIEDLGGVYTDGHVPMDLLDILKAHGFNYVRLRIWHNPPEGYCDLESTLRMAARAEEKGFGILIDFHYSDTWADPGRQTKPAAWSAAGGEALRDSVRRYTKQVVEALGDQGTLPDMVQVGNEISCGMLWNDGRVCGTFDTPRQWDEFAALVKAAILGVRDASGDAVLTMIHIDRGGDNAASRWFFDNLRERGVDFDIIGLSFYPWWQGSFDDLQANLTDLAARYEKGLIIAETAYPWTLGWHDRVHNPVGLPEHLHPGYPATVEGQKDFISALMRIVAGVPGGRGLGVFYWAPEYVSVPPAGSSWENLALFDFQGEALPALDAFAPAYRDSAPPEDSGR